MFSQVVAELPLQPGLHCFPLCVVGLPEQYHQLYTHLLTLSCARCHSVPERAAICLLCGALVCVSTECCATRLSSSSSHDRTVWFAEAKQV